MKKVPKILNWSECDWRNSRPGIRGLSFHGEQMSVQLGEIMGNEAIPHSHAHEQIVMILGGTCDFYVDGVPYPLSKGCLMCIPPHAEHCILATGTEPVYNLDIFYPGRPERVESVPREDGRIEDIGF